ncbi:MAG: GNAT family N-acetyltransferase [Gemmataceae bacterium]
MPIAIRTATPSDVGVIVEYNRRLARETESKELDLPIVTAGVAAAVADPVGRGPYFLACDGDDVVGQLQVTLEWSDWRNGWYWWIQSVYVRADWRGRGVFGTLYRHVRQAAVAAGDVVGLRLYVERENHAAQTTYAKMGMEVAPYYMMHEWPLARSPEPGVSSQGSESGVRKTCKTDS